MKKFLLALAIAAQTFHFSYAQSDSLRISLLTCEPGAAIYELYGHTAIRVQDFIRGRDLVFNYGLFDFSTPHFAWLFTLGKTDYLLGAQHIGSFMDEYRTRGSAVWSQQLNLTPQENAYLYRLLLENSMPGNRVYRYNFLYGNCATMAIDKIEQCISGSVTYRNSTSGESFRTILDSHTCVKPWSQLAVDLIVGAQADRQPGYREEAFAPMRLMDMAANAVICDSDGSERPLVLQATELVSPDHSVDFGKCLISPVQAMCLLILLTLLICMTGWYRGKLYFIYDCILFGVQGLAGLVVTFMFLFSSHPTVGSNWIIAILNPLPLFFIPFTAVRIHHGRKDIFLAVLFVMAAAFALLAPVIPQDIHEAVRLFSVCLAIRAFSSTLFIFKNSTDRPHKKRKAAGTGLKCLTIAAAMTLAIPVCAQSNVPKPKLIVGITVDRLDSNCMFSLMSRFGNDGIRKMWYEGYSFSNTSFDFTNPDRASATAALFSGSVPYDNGIMAERWMSRSSLNEVVTVDDSNCPGVNTMEFTSPVRLQASNLADVIKLSTDGASKVCAIAIEREEAVLSAGHEADLAVWMNPNNGQWCSSDYYGGLPAWICPEEEGHNDMVSRWEPLYPSGYYVQKSDHESYRQFSHSVSCSDMSAYRSSPAANSRTVDMAIKAVSEMGLGLDSNTDLLSVTLYGGNFEGQPSSLWSLEQQDLYLRLDKDIARLADTICSQFSGKGDVLFFLTSNGCSIAPVQNLTGTRIPSGTVNMERIIALLNLYLSAKYDCPSLAATYYRNHIYLNHQAIEKAGLELHKVLDSSIDLLVQASGIRNVILLRDLQSVIPDRESLVLRNSLSPAFSGDIIVQSLPGWTIVDERHGISISGKPYDNSFPMVIYGSGIRSQVNHEAVSASVLAPTIAAIARAGMPNACVTAPITGIGK